jgi:hypothetical protein
VNSKWSTTGYSEVFLRISDNMDNFHVHMIYQYRLQL